VEGHHGGTSQLGSAGVPVPPRSSACELPEWIAICGVLPPQTCSQNDDVEFASEELHPTTVHRGSIIRYVLLTCIQWADRPIAVQIKNFRRNGKII